MNRRNFLTRSALVLPALLVGDAALEAFARLTHVRKSFPSAPVQLTAAEQMERTAEEFSSRFFYGHSPHDPREFQGLAVRYMDPARVPSTLTRIVVFT